MAAEQDARDVVVEWIDYILDRKKWTGTDLARHSDLAPSTVLRMLNDPNHRFTPSLKTLQKISRGSGYPIPAKVSEVLGAPDIEPSDATRADQTVAGSRSRDAHQQSSSPRSKNHINVRYVSSLPESMHPVLKNEVSVPCPVNLDGDQTAFAFYMPGSDLEPWIKAGTLMYATQRRDPYSGDMVLITDKSGKSRVRLLLEINEKGLMLAKEHPPKKPGETMKFDDVKDIAIISGMDRI